MPPPRSRVSVLDSVKQEELEEIFKSWLAKQVNRDFWSLLLMVRQYVTWKTTPQLVTLVHYSSLFNLFADCAPSGVLPNKQLQYAILALNRGERMNHTAMNDMDTPPHSYPHVSACVRLLIE